MGQLVSLLAEVNWKKQECWTSCAQIHTMKGEGDAEQARWCRCDLPQRSWGMHSQLGRWSSGAKLMSIGNQKWARVL